MKRLNDHRLSELREYLDTCGLTEAMKMELLDHLACEAEERMWVGQSAEQALEALRCEVGTQALEQLNAELRTLSAQEDSLNDIVFEHRNKQYGAYVLRRDYGGTVQRATMIGVGVFLLIFLLPELYARLKPAAEEGSIAYAIEADLIKITPEKVIPPPPDRTLAPPPTVKTTRMLPPKVLPDDQVLNEQVPPVIEKFEDSQPGQKTEEGNPVAELIVPPAEIAGSAKETVVEVKPKEETLLFAEQQPEFIGGQEAFASFLRKNLKYPTAATRAGVQGKVFVEFTVGLDGKIEKARTVKGIGFGCDEEALRVINKMPAWMPGKQSGQPVRVRYTLPISFQLD